jgi:transcriptional regulator with XRE-family HTH domain
MTRQFSGRQLRAARRAAGVRSDELARAAGRSAWTIRNYERGRSTPPAGLLPTLADALGCSMDALYSDDHAPALVPELLPVDHEPDARRLAPAGAVTVTEWAARAGRSTAYVRRLCQLGQLPARRTERVWLIDRTAEPPRNDPQSAS